MCGVQSNANVVTIILMCLFLYTQSLLVMDLTTVFDYNKPIESVTRPKDRADATSYYTTPDKWALLYHDAKNGILYDQFGVFVHKGYFVMCPTLYWERRVPHYIKTRFNVISACNSLGKIFLECKRHTYIPSDKYYGTIYISPESIEK